MGLADGIAWERDYPIAPSNSEPIYLRVAVGDRVVDIYGREGIVFEICKCGRCKERGWCEPVVKFSNGEMEWINDYDAKHGFSQYYQIGENIFREHLHYDELDGLLATALENLERLVGEADNLRKMMLIARPKCT